jgi:S-adenosylmethionine:tRNA ribosyltransferase-isomerase
MGYSLKEFNISIPEELIAQYPSRERQHSRLLVLNSEDGSLKDDHFYNLGRYIGRNDCVIFNDTRVINARMFGHRETKDGAEGARFELLLTRRLDYRDWRCLIRPARRVGEGTRIKLDSGQTLQVQRVEGEGSFIVSFNRDVGYEELLEMGEIPLPKYIKRRPQSVIDDTRYQTIYSKHYGAVAAPTAGLHFSEGLIGRLNKKGVRFIPITLHVDWGTFKPVRSEDYRRHAMHRERFEISETSAQVINECREQGRRIVCVGTTSVRAVESAAVPDGTVRAGVGETSLYIYPGYSFRITQAMITNFHMPDSTLILLVAAFAGKENIERAYNHAVAHRYRFFSYGDAMFIDGSNP